MMPSGRSNVTKGSSKTDGVLIADGGRGGGWSPTSFWPAKDVVVERKSGLFSCRHFQLMMISNFGWFIDWLVRSDEFVGAMKDWMRGNRK